MEPDFTTDQVKQELLNCIFKRAAGATRSELKELAEAYSQIVQLDIARATIGTF